MGSDMEEPMDVPDVPEETTASARADESGRGRSTSPMGPRLLSPGRLGAFQPYSAETEDDGSDVADATDEGGGARAPQLSMAAATHGLPPTSATGPGGGGRAWGTSPEGPSAAQFSSGVASASARPFSPAHSAASLHSPSSNNARGSGRSPLAQRGRSASPPPEWPKLSETENLESDEEFWNRQKLTGAIGRLVHYSVGEVPQDDIIGLASTKNGRIMVTSVRRDGPASRAGVLSGDLLASVDGNIPPAGTSAKALLQSLRAPVSIVFMGFVGKLQAEVRVKYPAVRCGVPEGIDVGNLCAQTAQTQRRGNSRFCDAVVFHQPAASLFITVRQPGETPRSQEDGHIACFFELQREDAKWIRDEALRHSRPATNRSDDDSI